MTHDLDLEHDELDAELHEPLHSHLHDTLADLRAPGGSAALVATAVADGRRALTRRRAGLALAVAASVTLVGGLAVALSGGSDRPVGPAGQGVEQTPPPLEPTEAPAPAGWWDTPSPQMLRTLRTLLPDDVRVTSALTTFDNGDGAGPQTADGALSGVLTGPAGSGAFQLLLRAPSLGDERGRPVLRDARCPRERPGAAAVVTCTEVSSPDGELTGRLSTDRERGTTYHSTVLVADDGASVYLYVADSSGEKPGYEEPSAPTPPLAPEQVLDLAVDPVWRA
ncbi:hypothetical protein [Nocardioides nanhaiensis]|uniref:Uncharacterized protein n=1 Tax=Nocardioides nanhaiensis TaxID=1476871 RepID=A0ABP8W318_9ACTN